VHFSYKLVEAIFYFSKANIGKWLQILVWSYTLWKISVLLYLGRGKTAVGKVEREVVEMARVFCRSRKW